MRFPFAVGCLGLLLAEALAGATAEESKPPALSGCVECHLALDDARVTPPARAFADDVHGRAGFTCAFCHGGDATQEDQELAHDPRKGFRGKIAPREIPGLCARCHSDPSVMKQFNPSLRVDQLAEYQTSGHGKKLLQGDERVAHCASCHGAHGVLSVKDSRSPVSPGRIAPTCNRCHGDAGLMAAYNLPSDVYAKYSRSVHSKARVEKGDLSAPTCNSCHGNHGAVPPEVGSVANVCGTCHATFADQFKLSPHWEAFGEMGLPGCVTCHENHEILPPTEAFLLPGPEGKCDSCHETGSAGAQAASTMRNDILLLRTEIRGAREILRRAAEAGMEVSRAEFELTKADDALTKARTDVHLFRASAVHQPVVEGVAVARAAKAAGDRALEERGFRRRGLLVSLGLIALSIIGLALAIRERNRRAPAPPSG
jgi:Cytochrome c3